MNSKIIGIAVLAIAGFFALIANAQMAGNQNALNITLSNSTVNQTANFTTVNQTVNLTTINQTANFTQTVNSTITNLVNTTNNTTNNTITNDTINTQTSANTSFTVEVSQGSSAITLGQQYSLTAISSVATSYSWFETLPNSGQSVPVPECTAVSTNVCSPGSIDMTTPGLYSFYVVSQDLGGEMATSAPSSVLVYPDLNLANLV